MPICVGRIQSSGWNQPRPDGSERVLTGEPGYEGKQAETGWSTSQDTPNSINLECAQLLIIIITISVQTATTNDKLSTTNQ